MAIGSSQSTGERLECFERGLVPKSSTIKEGYVVVHASTTDDKVVDLPNAAGVLLGGRAYAGVSAAAGTTDNTKDNQITVQRLGVAKCALKASTACTAGDYAAYDPVDGGPVVPYTSPSQVVIGKFTQTKLSSASEQFVGVFLQEGLGAGTNRVTPPLGIITSPSATLTNTTVETVMTAFTIPAAFTSAGTILRLRAKCAISSGNSTDTLTLRVRLDTVAGTILAASPAVNVTDAGGDIGIIDLTLIVGAAGNVISTVGTAGISPGQAVATGGNVQTVGSAGYVAFNPALSHQILVTGQWSAASASDIMLLESAFLSA